MPKDQHARRSIYCSEVDELKIVPLHWISRSHASKGFTHSLTTLAYLMWFSQKNTNSAIDDIYFNNASLKFQDAIGSSLC